MEIILIRHGRPASANNRTFGAVDYLKWIRQYNLSDVASDSRPLFKIENLNSYYLVSSHLNRAIHSTKLYTGREPDHVSDLYKEMDIPRYKLPIRLKAMTWVYLCRLIWMCGAKGPFESFHQAKIRAEQASLQLIELAKTEGKIVLFGHGYMNFFIRKNLVRQGWLLENKNSHYWGVTTLKFNKYSI